MLNQQETHTFHYLTDEASTVYSHRFVMDAKCGCCCPDPLFMIEWDFGVKKLEEPFWKLKRIPGRRTWRNWFPKDEGLLEGDSGIILYGVDYDDMLRYALGAGMKVQIVEE